MQKQALIVVGALLAAITGAFVVPQFLGSEEAPVTPVGKWTAKDEIELAGEAANADATAETSSVDRTAIELPAADTAEDRVELVLHGRVIDKFKAPIANANVWLDFGRGGPRGGNNGRQRRVPDPVLTDKDGRFSFQGQTYRNLRVSLQVSHQRFAPGQFDKDLGAVTDGVDLGDLVLQNGGKIRGRVTDLDSNAIPAAELHLQPQNGNGLRFLRDRDRLLPPVTTDSNGFYLVEHATAGDWSLTATAARHQEGRSATFAVEEDQAVDVPDIRLGPGFEVTGFVRNLQGAPIAKANVRMRSEDRGRPNADNGSGGGSPGSAGPGGPGGRNFGFGFGRDYTTTTDDKGRFYLDHLPGVSMQLDVDADGFLDYSQAGIDTRIGQPLQVAMQDGLKIEADVKDKDGTAVTLFAFRAVRLRPLSVPGLESLDPQEIFTKLRDGNLDPNTAAQLRQQAESLRSQFGGRGNRGPQGGPQGPGGPQGQGRGAQDLGRPERHPEGHLVASGLQEGVYELHVQSPDYARFQSAEVEVRATAPTPQVLVTLDSGAFVAGAVVDDQGQPIRGAQVELRSPSPFGRGRGRQNGGTPNNGTPTDASAPGQVMADMARQFMRQASGAQVTLEATTNEEGVFVIKHATHGSWQLNASARGFASASSEAFDLDGDRSGFELKLSSLGSIEGKVAGLRDNEAGEAHVAAVPVANSSGNGGGPGMWFGGGRGGPGGGGRGPFQSVSVNPDGSYRISDLAPGDYLVRSWIGDAQDIMRELMPQFMAGKLVADVAVHGGTSSHFDPVVTRPQIGTVMGTVMINGLPASGFQVELQHQSDPNDPNADNNAGGFGMRGPGGRGRGFGQSLQSTVASSGHFKIDHVAAGNYQLRVTTERQRSPLYTEIVQVAADTIVQRDLSLQSYRLDGTVGAEDGVKPADIDGRVSLLPGLTALPEDFGNSRPDSSIDARVTDGKFSFEHVQPGSYLLVLSLRNRERASQVVVVGSDQTLTVTAGKAVAPDAANPNAASGGANGRQGGGPGNGGGNRANGGGRQRGPGGGQNGGGQNGGGRRGGRQGQGGATPPGGG